MKAIIPLLLSVVLLMAACNGAKKTQDSTAQQEVPKSKEVAKADPPQVAQAPEKPEGALTPTPPNETPRYTKSLPDSLFVSIERTPCFGRCPTYKLMVFQSGYATLHVKNWVESLENGKYETRISKAEMDQIRQRIEAVAYYKLPNEFDGPITDIPSTFTAANINGRKKRVKNRYDAPVKLQEYEKFLDGLLLKRSDWKPMPPREPQD